MMPASMQSRYIWVILVLVFGVFLANTTAVLIVDPQKVFGLVDVNRRNFEPNTRFLKTAYLRDHPEFDSFVLGSSRANAYSVDTAQQLVGGRFYNFTVGGDTPLGMLRKAEWLAENRQLTHLVVTFSFDDFIYSDAEQERALEIEHPWVSQSGWLKFWKPYLFGPYAHPLPVAQALYGNFIKKDDWYTFDIRTGHYDFPFFRRQMQQDPKAYVENRFYAPPMFERFSKSDSLKHLQSLVHVARSKGIDLVVIINPDNHRTFLSFRPDAYRSWLTDIVRITGGVWDFSGLNAVTRSDAGYFEQRHFSELIGDEVLTRIFEPDSEIAQRHPDFGRWVTSDNLSARLAALNSDWIDQGGRLMQLAQETNRK